MKTEDEYRENETRTKYFRDLVRGGTRLQLDKFICGDIPITVNVRCGGKQHKIRFDGKNLILLNHPHEKRDRLLVGMGDKCRCLDVLDGWRKEIVYVIPDALHEAYYGIRLAGKKEASNRSKIIANTSKTANRYRLPASMTELIVKQWEKTAGCLLSHLEEVSYRRRIVEGSPSINFVSIRPTESMSHAGLMWPHADVISSTISNKTSCTLYLYVRPSWRKAVMEEGLATVDDHLVLDVCHQSEVAHYRSRFGDDYRTWLRRPWWSYVSEAFDSTKTIVLAVMVTPLTVYTKPAEVIDDPVTGMKRLVWIETVTKNRSRKK